MRPFTPPIGSTQSPAPERPAGKGQQLANEAFEFQVIAGKKRKAPELQEHTALFKPALVKVQWQDPTLVD